jgi:hypothetical protein
MRAHITSLPLNSKSTKLGLSLAQNILAGNLTSGTSPSLLNLIPTLALLSHANQQLITLRELLDGLREFDASVLSLWGLDGGLAITVGSSLGRGLDGGLAITVGSSLGSGLALLGGSLGLITSGLGLGTTLLGGRCSDGWGSGLGSVSILTTRISLYLTK